MQFCCKLCRCKRHSRPYRLLAKDRSSYEALRCSQCGLFQVPYDWADFKPYVEDEAHARDYQSLLDFLTSAELGALQRKAEFFANMVGERQGLEGTSVLDIGCGEGHFLRACGQRGARRLVGIEWDDVSARYAREMNGVTEIWAVDIADVTAVPDNSFDLVCSFDVAEHVHDLAAFLDNSVRVVRPGGLVVHATPGADSITTAMGRLLSRLGINRRAASRLCNIGVPRMSTGHAHVQLLDRRSAAYWATARGDVELEVKYFNVLTYSDIHYAQYLRPIPPAVSVPIVRLLRGCLSTKLVLFCRKSA